ncbi:MAG: RecQ family ATP-dependent DNA helicase [Paludibacteraceae bacterium]|nr:RecQ family ATP-dependent DNA helicase [Paludibacteraceae bacterium]
MTALEALHTYFGYDDFRPMQQDIIESVLAGKDTLALLPTGGGKSLCFQVPTLVMADNNSEGEGLCLVITPLIALMKDQVANLRQRNILATAIYTGMSREEQRIAFDNCLYGPYRFLYVSPERLESDEFLKRVIQLPICMIAVDEAHCISQWGYDFRPSYLRIAEIREHVQAPILALTATATPEVVDDIQQRLGFAETNVFRTSFARPNLHYVVRHTEDKPGQLLHILERVPGSAIVYVRNRKRTRELSEYINSQLSAVSGQQSADYYHAGLPTTERAAKQQAWKDGNTRIIVCTNAFGMGIDKPDVRLVIHYDLPDSIEAYFQEAGRAGRDGEQAWCVLLHAPKDSVIVKQRIGNNYPPQEEVERVYQLLCDYLTIGLGSGRDATFAIDVEQFCTDMHLSFLTTYASLQLLTNAGYISYTDEQDLQPRVRIVLDKEALYQLEESPFQERLLSALMRRYSGIFTDAQFIHLSRLAEDLGSTEFAVNSSLVALAKQHIIRYIPAQRVSMVHFPVPRQNTASLSDNVYADRKQIFERNLQAMLEYAENDHYCRSQLLLGYFGEQDAPLCGMCDICITNKKNEV